MTLRTLVLVAGVGLAAVALPATSEAAHRHSRSCRHSQVDRYQGHGYQGYGYQGYGYNDANPYPGYGYYYDEPRYVYAPRVRPRHSAYRPHVRHFLPRLHLHFGR